MSGVRGEIRLICKYFTVHQLIKHMINPVGYIWLKDKCQNMTGKRGRGDQKFSWCRCVLKEMFHLITADEFSVAALIKCFIFLVIFSAVVCVSCPFTWSCSSLAASTQTLVTDLL